MALHPNYVTRVLEIAEAKYADNVAVTHIAKELRRKRELAMSLRHDPTDRLKKIREASSGASNGLPMMNNESTLITDLMMELDVHRSVGILSMLLAGILSEFGEVVEE